MKKSFIAAALAAAALASPAHAATDAECQAMWTKADANKDGVLSNAEASRYGAFMRIADRKMSTEGRITQAEFMDACKADAYTPRKADAGAPLKGANSFTEGQAKDRALAQGLDEVASLKKDDDGIWRGAGTMGGKTVQIAVDYKGNVVTANQ